MALHVVLPHLLLSARPESFPRSLRTKERDAPSDSLPAGLDSLRRTPPAGSRVLLVQDPSRCNHPRGPVRPTGNGVTQ